MNGTLDMQKDGARLRTQMDRVRSIMGSGEWFTLNVLALCTGGSEAGVSARIRDLRKEGRTVERRRIPGENGLWEYRLEPRNG